MLYVKYKRVPVYFTKAPESSRSCEQQSLDAAVESAIEDALTGALDSFGEPSLTEVAKGLATNALLLAQIQEILAQAARLRVLHESVDTEFTATEALPRLSENFVLRRSTYSQAQFFYKAGDGTIRSWGEGAPSAHVYTEKGFLNAFAPDVFTLAALATDPENLLTYTWLS